MGHINSLLFISEWNTLNVQMDSREVIARVVLGFYRLVEAYFHSESLSPLESIIRRRQFKPLAAATFSYFNIQTVSAS